MLTVKQIVRLIQATDDRVYAISDSISLNRPVAPFNNDDEAFSDVIDRMIAHPRIQNEINAHVNEMRQGFIEDREADQNQSIEWIDVSADIQV